MHLHKRVSRFISRRAYGAAEQPHARLFLLVEARARVKKL